MDKFLKTDEIIEKKLAYFYNMHINCQINLTAIKERDEILAAVVVFRELF